MYLTNEFNRPKIDFLWLELTNQCNLKCVHCYTNSGPEAGGADTMTFDDYARLLKESRELGCEAIQFIGGEPTLNKGLEGLITTAKELGFKKIEVFTNLVALPKSLLECFIQNGVDVATSIYSNDPAVHDSITERKGSHERTVGNLIRVVESGLNLRAGIIEMEQNKGGIETTVAWLQSLGVQNIGADQQRGFGRAAPPETAPEMSDLCGQCAGGTLAVSPDGAISPCIMSKHWAVGNAAETSLENLFKDSDLSEVRRQIGEATRVTAWCNPERQTCIPSNAPTPCTPCLPNGYCSPKSCIPNP